MATYRVQILREWLGIVIRRRAYWIEADSIIDLAAQIRGRYLDNQWRLTDVMVDLDKDANGKVIAGAAPDGTGGRLVAVVLTERVPS